MKISWVGGRSTETKPETKTQQIENQNENGQSTKTKSYDPGAGVRKERPWRQHWCSSVPVATLVALAASAFQWSLFRPTSHYWSPFGLPPAPHILLFVRFLSGFLSFHISFINTAHGFSVKLVYWTMFRLTSQWSPFTPPPGPHIYAWPLWAMATFRYIFILSAVGVRSSSQ